MYLKCLMVVLVFYCENKFGLSFQNYCMSLLAAAKYITFVVVNFCILIEIARYAVYHTRLGLFSTYIFLFLFCMLIKFICTNVVFYCLMLVLVFQCKFFFFWLRLQKIDLCTNINLEYFWKTIDVILLKYVWYNHFSQILFIVRCLTIDSIVEISKRLSSTCFSRLTY